MCCQGSTHELRAQLVPGSRRALLYIYMYTCLCVCVGEPPNEVQAKRHPLHKHGCTVTHVNARPMSACLCDAVAWVPTTAASRYACARPVQSQRPQVEHNGAAGAAKAGCGGALRCVYIC